MKKSQNLIADTQAKTLDWDAADYLEDLEDVVAYMEAAFEDGDSRVITAALGDIARSKGMTAIAGQVGMGRESLYKALSRDGNPGFSSVLKIMKVVGLRLHPLAVDQVPAMLEGESGSGWSVGFVLPPPDLYVASGKSGARSVRRASECR